MKIKLAKQAILDGLQKVESVITARTTQSILQNVLIKTEKDCVYLTGTDLDITVRTKVPAEVLKMGATTLPARRIALLFKEMESSEIQVEVGDNDVASIRAGSSFFKIKGISEEDFPALPKFDGGKTYIVEQGLLSTMLKHTSYAVSRDESRYILTGVLLSFRSSKLTVVGTDGRRLALYESEIEFSKDMEADYVIPFKAVDELIRTLGEDGAVKITGLTNQILFEFGDVMLVTKLVEGTYPNFRQVIPAQCAERVKLERELFLGAVKRASLLAREKTNSVKLSFEKNKLLLTAVAPDIGEAEETLTIAYAGKPMVVAFNPDFLMDALRILTQDEINLELTDDLNPALIKVDAPFLYVIMPMRTG